MVRQTPVTPAAEPAPETRGFDKQLWAGIATVVATVASGGAVIDFKAAERAEAVARENQAHILEIQKLVEANAGRFEVYQTQYKLRENEHARLEAALREACGRR